MLISSLLVFIGSVNPVDINFEKSYCVPLLSVRHGETSIHSRSNTRPKYENHKALFGELLITYGNINKDLNAYRSRNIWKTANCGTKSSLQHGWCPLKSGTLELLSYVQADQHGRESLLQETQMVWAFLRKLGSYASLPGRYTYLSVSQKSLLLIWTWGGKNLENLISFRDFLMLLDCLLSTKEIDCEME